jgi:uncharacterized protein (TIGR00290 family)
MYKSFMNWSGGKDSSLALHKILHSTTHEVGCLLTSMNAAYDRISMHGVRRELLHAQVQSIGIPLHTIELPEQPAMEEYQAKMRQAVDLLSDQMYTHAVFGDIFLEDLRLYREEQLRKAGIQCVFPLWKRDTKELASEFIETGFRAVVVCVNEQFLDKSFCGRIIDREFLADLPSNVDPCGENGEFHSFVFDGPIFRNKVPFQIGEMVHRKYTAPKKDSSCDTSDEPSQTGFYFCDLFLGKS